MKKQLIFAPPVFAIGLIGWLGSAIHTLWWWFICPLGIRDVGQYNFIGIILIGGLLKTAFWPRKSKGEVDWGDVKYIFELYWKVGFWVVLGWFFWWLMQP